MKTRDEINDRRRAWRKRPEVRDRELSLRRKSYWKNVEHNRSLLRASRARHVEQRRRRSLEWYYANKEKAQNDHREWCRANRDKTNAYKRKQMRHIAFRVYSTTKHRIWHGVHTRKTKPSKVSNLLGCSKEFLIGWLEQQFQPGMSWDNYGRYGWHIDHKRPLSSFDLTDPTQQKICFHYTNLQPLWWRDNLSKRNKWKEAA